MKKTKFIELFKNINKTKVSFFSIAFFIMLGTTGYLGVSWSVNGFTNTVEKTLNDAKFQDIEIKHPYGLDDNYINDLSKLDGVDFVEGEYSCYSFFKLNGSTLQAKVTSITNNINVIEALEGTLPKTNKECAIEKYYADTNGIKVGDTITFIHDDESAYQLSAIINNNLETLKTDNKVNDKDGMAYLTNDSFVVTALVDSPEHIGKYETQLGFSSDETPVNVIIYVTKNTFDKNYSLGYSKILVVNNDLRKYNSNSDEYIENNEALIEKIKDFSDKYIANRNSIVLGNRDSLKNQIYDEIVQGEQDILDGKDEIAKNERKISRSSIELSNAKKQLLDSEAQVAAGRSEYNSKYSEYRKSEITLNVFQKIYDVINKAINIYRNIDESKDEIDDRITKYKTIYDDLVRRVGESELTNSKYVAEKLVDFFEDKIKNKDYRKKASDYVDKYNAFVMDLMKDNRFPKQGNVIDELEIIKENFNNDLEVVFLINDLERLTNEIYDDINLVMQLPTNILETYDELKYILKEMEKLYEEYRIENPNLKPFDEFVREYSIKVIDEELTNNVYPTTQKILTYIDNAVNYNYNNYQSLKPLIDETFVKLSDLTDKFEGGLQKHIDPKLKDAWNKINSAKRELDSALNKLRNAEKDIADGWNKYNKGIKALESGKLEIEDAKIKLVDAEADLIKGKDLYDKYVETTQNINTYDATIIGRQSNISIITTKFASDIITKLKYTMAILFVVVGVFVSYTSMSRLVYDQTVFIGTKKALGLKQKEITTSFLLYSLLATIFGSFLGILLSRFIIEPIIVAIIADSFNLRTFYYYFGLNDFILFTLFEIVVTLAASFLASHRILKSKAVELLAGKKQTIGKHRFYEKSSLWNNLPLLTKTIINNCFNDTRRVFGTIVGIAGCASLLVCAISFNNNINDSISKQKNQINTFDTFIYFDSEEKLSEKSISNALDRLNIEYTSATCKVGLLKGNDGNYARVYLYSANDDEMYNYRHLMIGNKEIIPTNGIVFSESFCKWNNINIDDDIDFVDSLGNEHTFTVEGYSENYMLCIDAYLSKESFENGFDQSIKNNVIFLKRNDKSLEEVKNAVQNCVGFLSIEDNAEYVESMSRSVTSIAFVIYAIFLVLSVLLAFLVILNLLVMFVDEKKKELIILMINGYKKKFAKKYIYTDTIFLTIIGIIIGSIFGSFIGILATNSLISSSSLFMTELMPKTYILASLITGALCAITSMFALRKIDNYKLTDINSK